MRIEADGLPVSAYGNLQITAVSSHFTKVVMNLLGEEHRKSEEVNANS